MLYDRNFRVNLKKSEPHNKHIDRNEWRVQVESAFFGIFVLIFINNCYDIENNAWKFQVSMMKIVPVARIWNSWVVRIMTALS